MYRHLQGFRNPRGRRFLNTWKLRELTNDVDDSQETVKIKRIADNPRAISTAVETLRTTKLMPDEMSEILNHDVPICVGQSKAEHELDYELKFLRKIDQEVERRKSKCWSN